MMYGCLQADPHWLTVLFFHRSSDEMCFGIVTSLHSPGGFGSAVVMLWADVGW